MNFQSVLINLVKLGLCGAVIAGIASLFVIFSEDGTVRDAEADLFDVIPRSALGKPTFDDVIASSGLEARPYDHNGNMVKSAVGVSELSPTALAQHYQEQFVKAGINSKVYDQSLFTHEVLSVEDAIAIDDDEALERQRIAMLNGEVVPLRLTDEHVALGGIVPHESTGDIEEILNNWRKNPHGIVDLDENMAGFRYLEARRAVGERQTTVSATWSVDQNFDARRSHNPRQAAARPDPNVPACIGCSRVNRLAALDSSEPYVLNHFETTESIDNTEYFYRQAMTERGWSLSEASDILRRLEPHVPYLMGLEGDFLSFERGDRFLTIYQVPTAPGKISVITMEGELPE